jgi:uncharacterized protein YndB with AHSA1/START domain
VRLVRSGLSCRHNLWNLRIQQDARAVEGNHATLSFRRRLKHPIATVWAAITNAEQRAHWLGATTIDGRVGGTIETIAEGPPVPRKQRIIRGRILIWDPPRIFEHEWNQLLVEKSVVRYELVSDGDATILTFTHRGLSLPNAKGYGPGTHAYLDRLEALLSAADLPDWKQWYGEVQRAYSCIA